MRMPIVLTITRLLILGFWIAAIVFFLMIPTILGYFSTERSLTIFTPPALLDPIYLKKFEKETGIKIYLTYFENGPALLSKLAATKGRGYDVIIPDDHSLELLIKQGFVKPIDKSKLPFWDNLNPLLADNYYDPHNAFSIPYYWGVYGVGYDGQAFPQGLPSDSWALLFTQHACAKVCMTDDPREAIMIAAQYLFGTIDALKDEQAREKVKQALIAQKPYVEVYTLSRSDNLLQTKSCALAAVMSPELLRLNRENPHIDMLIPKEGSFYIVDAIAIPKTTQKDAMIYQFLNFLYQEESILHHSNLYGFCSPLTSITVPDQEKFCPTKHDKKFDFFRNVISDELINEIWIEVLAS